MSSIAEQFLSLLNCYVSSWFARTLDGFEMNLYILKPCDFFLLFGLNISNSIHFVGIYWYIRERVSQLRNNWLLVILLCEHFGAKSLKELSPLECVDVWYCSLFQRARARRRRRRMMTFPRTGSFPRAPCCPRSLPPPSKACWKFCVTNRWVKK